MAIDTIVLCKELLPTALAGQRQFLSSPSGGLKAIAVQNPLSSLADDVSAAHRVVDVQEGPVLMVGHSWGEAVITEAGSFPNPPRLPSLSRAAVSL